MRDSFHFLHHRPPETLELFKYGLCLISTVSVTPELLPKVSSAWDRKRCWIIQYAHPAEFRFSFNRMQIARKLLPIPTLCTDSSEKSMKYCQIHLQICVTVKRFGYETFKRNIQHGKYSSYLLFVFYFFLLRQTFAFRYSSSYRTYLWFLCL